MTAMRRGCPGRMARDVGMRSGGAYMTLIQRSSDAQTRSGRALEAVVVAGRGQMRDIAPVDDARLRHTAVAREIDDIDARVQQRPRARRGQFDAVGETVDAIEHAAMRDDRDAASRMLCEDRFQRVQNAVIKRALRLALGRLETGIARLPVRVFIGKTLGDLVAVVALERAVVALAHAFGQLQRQAERVGNRLRRLLRAHQVAGPYRIESRPRMRGLRDLRSEPLCLLDAALGERNVDMALDALDAVPGGFTVTDEKNLRGHESAMKERNGNRG
ncbi:hypothetical protein PT2222_160061 [Paraburkholderia tropica]